MVSFLLPLAAKVIDSAIAKIPDNEELGDKLIEICLHILAKAVKLTKTDMDDKLLEQVSAAIKSRWLYSSVDYRQVANNNVWVLLNTGAIYSSP